MQQDPKSDLMLTNHNDQRNGYTAFLFTDTELHFRKVKVRGLADRVS